MAVDDPQARCELWMPLWVCHLAFLLICDRVTYPEWHPKDRDVLLHLFLMVLPPSLLSSMLLSVLPSILLHFLPPFRAFFSSNHPCIYFTPPSHPSIQPSFYPATQPSNSHCLPTMHGTLCLALEMHRWLRASKVPVLKEVMFWWEAMHISKSS